MQFIHIKENTKLTDLVKYLGTTAVNSILSVNDLLWEPNVGLQYYTKCKDIIKDTLTNITAQRKSTILNRFVQDEDIYEKAALASEDEWKILSALGSFADALKIPEGLIIPDSSNVFGSGVSVPRNIYDRSMSDLKRIGSIDPAIFNTYSTSRSSSLGTQLEPVSNAMQWFKIPWGKITLYSSLDNDSIDFPCYPEELSDGVKANYATMPDILYQYEPWQLYQNSGPRTLPLTFDIHRHMWSGDHNDGMANKLIRFCESLCYPSFNGSLVNTPIVTLYFEGKPLIRGVITDVQTDWDGPIADDGWYLHFKLQLNITEVSADPLNHEYIKNKSIIG